MKLAAARWAWFLYPLALFVAMLAWAGASSPGSSPDEDYHLASIWCALGDREGLCEQGSTPATRLVPAEITQSSCFAFKSNKSAACLTEAQGMAETTRWNNVGYYPNGFYTVMGLFAGPSLSVSVLLIRALNALIHTAGLTALFLLAPAARRANYLLVSLITIVPLGMFIVPSVNPSSWAITSAFLVWPSAIEFVRTTDRRQRIWWAILGVIGLVLAVSSRADAAAYAGLAIGLVWLATGKFDRLRWFHVAIATAGVAALALWSTRLRSTLAAFTPGARPGQDASAGGWFERIQDLPNLFAGVFTRHLGWLDTPLSPMARVFLGWTFAMVVFWSLRRYDWRKLTALLVIAVIGTVVPMVIATLRDDSIASALQPRYFMPLLIVATLIAVTENNPDGPQLNQVQGWLIVVALGLGHASALHTNIRRYTTGLDVNGFNLNAQVEWWWSAGPSPMLVYAVGVLAFFAAAWLVAGQAIKGTSGLDSPTIASLNR